MLFLHVLVAIFTPPMAWGYVRALRTNPGVVVDDKERVMVFYARF